MRIVLTLVGVLLVLSGIVWILQGFNILLGSFMSGRMEYAMLGAAALAVGAAVIFFANRRAK